MKTKKRIPATLPANSPLFKGGTCMDCLMGFLTANDADHHFKSAQHRYRKIDPAIERAFPGTIQHCNGYAHPLIGRWWLDG